MFNRTIQFLALFLGILVACLLFWVNIQGKRINSLEASKKVLESNANFLIKKVEREHNDKMELGRKNQELESLAKHSVDFDWNRDISRDELVLWLRENAVRVQGSRARAD